MHVLWFGHVNATSLVGRLHLLLVLRGAVQGQVDHVSFLGAAHLRVRHHCTLPHRSRTYQAHNKGLTYTLDMKLMIK